MEDDLRSFQSVSIGLTSVENGKERFTRDGLYNPPPLAYWRNNLTALSQRYNLYLVANRDSVAVYRPEFPFQKLHRLPALLIPPTLANPSAGGYIDTHSPHTINHIVVGDLGSEEIVLVATDSGNITGYFTKAIDEAVRKDPYRFSTNARSDYVGVRAFFSQSVHESAWGLAIHSQARMIAVSANTPHYVPNDDPCAKLTVFAFALTHDDADVDEDSPDTADFIEYARQPDWEEWEAKGVQSAPPPRDKNYKITLGGVEGHDHNIPSVSFVNTDEDIEGKWLLSTDIGGQMKVWQIWQGICLKSWDFGEKRMRSGFFRRREGGWLVAALDPAGFRSAWTMEQFCGHSKAALYHGHAGESYDLTNIVRLRTPGNSLAHPSINSQTNALVPDENDHEMLDSWSDLEDYEDQLITNNIGIHGDNATAQALQAHVAAAGVDQTTRSTEGIGAVAANATSTTLVEPTQAAETADRDSGSLELILMEEDDESDSDGNDGEDIQYEWNSDGREEQLSSSSHHSATSLSSIAPRNSVENDAQWPFTPDVQPFSISQYALQKPDLRRKRGYVAPYARGARTPSDIPMIPTLHCSASNLRLVMAPEADSPHVFCANILKQALPDDIELTNHVHLDRINMLQQIPELGVVIVASQIGRCAICTTTRNEKTGALGLRVDWVLPSRKQELGRVRPFMPLLGIAVSPVQGRFVVGHAKRWSGSEDSTEWGSDGIVDGVKTTFDPTVVTVTEPDSQEATDHTASEDSGKGPDTDDHQPPRDVHGTNLSDTTAEQSWWEKPAGREPWLATENGRRYRLMLTYLDMTVLTYEISRQVERDDIAQDEVSSLELMD
ncbi:hypothetical protein EDD37DRAFT_450127 [Exophiala viscosa]|uniref:uncharacterized protein n=1 Tax=Exophiala viscosa TaxID=2486360 RepID=UPI0021947033|nr:hypothetical protein EDD37DRAFT_450127 [Exophiala viscosa]